MPGNKYANIMNPNTPVPQSEPVPGKAMVKNKGGGYAFAASNWQMLKRWLILGSEGGTFYATERELTFDNIKALDACIAEDGGRTVTIIHDISVTNAALRQSAVIYGLARCFLIGDVDTRRAVSAVSPLVLRTASMLFEFLSIVRADKHKDSEGKEKSKSFGRVLRRLVEQWYNNRDARDLAYQMVKYRERNGMTHKDVLKLARPEPIGTQHEALFKWAMGKMTTGWDKFLPDQVNAYEDAKTAAPAELSSLIIKYRLPREAVPNNHLNDKMVWDALLQDMPLHALIRNLGKMTSVGVIAPLSNGRGEVIKRLTDGAKLVKGRIHPLAILLAMRQYATGASAFGHNAWRPDDRIMDALSEAFYLAFDGIEVSDKRVVLGIDISTSMKQSYVSGTRMSAVECAAALAMVYMKQYHNCELVAFNQDVYTNIGISPGMRLDAVLNQMLRLSRGGTNLAAPIVYMRERKVVADALITLSDYESWAGESHMFQEMRYYTNEVNPDVRFVNVQSTPNLTTLIEPGDMKAMEVIGFGADVPAATALFINGEI